MKGMHKVVADITTAINPHLTVVDGFVAMEGRGPVGGSPVQMDIIVAGRDVVAVDATVSRLMGIDPHLIGHIMMAQERGLGEVDSVEVLGESLADAVRVFKRP